MSGSQDAAVYVDSVSKSFGTKKALDNLSFEAPKGTVLGVLGPNGAGKTTTIKILSTLLKPDSGTVRVAGFDVVRDGAQVRRSIMMTGQYAAVDVRLTGRQNLILFGRLLGLHRRQAATRAAELLEQFDLTDSADRAVVTYSGGMRRRVDLACGLVVRPEIVFLDEPTTGLDPRARQGVFDLVRQLRDEGVTLLLTTQYLEEADILSDNIVVIDRGRVIASGTPNGLKDLAGGTHCHIALTDSHTTTKALAALGDLVSARSPKPEDLTEISIPAPDGPATLTEALRRLDAAAIEPLDISLRRPTLDDVFLSLTSASGQP